MLFEGGHLRGSTVVGCRYQQLAIEIHSNRLRRHHNIGWTLFRIVYVNYRVIVLPLCPSCARRCQEHGRIELSGSPTCRSRSHRTDPRPGGTGGQASGGTSSSTDRSAISASWGEQIQEALRVQCFGPQQVNACCISVHIPITAGHSSFLVEIQQPSRIGFPRFLYSSLFYPTRRFFLGMGSGHHRVPASVSFVRPFDRCQSSTSHS